ncbi:Uncharacterized conserved protein YafD, endonuclease/exonuclease/phosphatase (EEP) superfamily [Marinobacter sp. LV10R510-11A]|uniref:endonuclease/exonuclease/phosphatase family protein n=1 Tax=Marinobacter sp. LV10R510-11A TaxID=1415568 RepID=UPI000BBF94CF|nr:endonuclease/exonuclease/phosphatase family protein [Marinobacter sp. LV10R510-11A]SOB75573.1 Uncharacterized conserved protein YafD, endonuclease/exonuclease/phosphatase (EEP) superfamily [Marinobacter sp. LV10R510-11A]
MILLTLSVFTITIAVATLLPLWRNPHWSVRIFDFPRLQLTILVVLLVIAQLFLLDLNRPLSWVLILVAVGALGAQLWWILPYTAIWPKEVKDAPTTSPERAFAILTSNVLTHNRNAEALLALVEEQVPSMHALVELNSGERVRVHFVHPAPPSPTENDESTERDAELVIVGRRVAESDEPVIVTGDLNDVAWSATTRLFRKVSGLLDPRVGRGFYSTFHADYRLLRWPLDHLFHSHHFTLASITRLPYIGSDHFPLLTRVVFAPTRGQNQEPLRPDDDDRSWAQEIAQSESATKEDVP